MTTISFGQALLILIDKNRDSPTNLKILKRLYFVGVQSERDLTLINKILQDDALKNYLVSRDYKVIDEDPSRRYFETHLAFETLKANLCNLDLNEMKLHFNSLLDITKIFIDRDDGPIIDVLKGEYKGRDSLYLEYSDAISNIKSDKAYEKFSSSEKEKLFLIIKSAFLAVIHAQNLDLPIDIYRRGIFSKDNKGREPKRTNDYVNSNNLGIMKSYMPIAHDDLAYSDTASLSMRAADQSHLDPFSFWAKDTARSLVEPFSNSISGTMLSQLRNLKFIFNNGSSNFKNGDRFANFIRCFASAMLYNSGGHTFYEFLKPLSLDEVADEFTFIEGFDSLNKKTLLLKGNEIAFDRALEDTIKYNKQILAKKSIQNSITAYNPIREISAIREKCDIYKKHLEDIIKSDYQKDNLSYRHFFSNVSIDQRGNLNIGPTIFDIKELINSIDSVKACQDIPNNVKMAIEKYKAVDEIQAILVKPEMKMKDKISHFQAALNKNKNIIEKNRNSTENGFQKIINDILEYFNIKNSKGALFIEQVDGISKNCFSFFTNSNRNEEKGNMTKKPQHTRSN